MKKIVLVTAACLALSGPALAQSNGNQSNQPQQQSQAGSQQQARPIQPSRLSRQDIREIQMSLNKDGFDAKRVDGLWGEHTREALKQFQQHRHLPGNGRLNQQTLAVLGVNLNNPPETTGSISNQGASQQPQGQNSSSPSSAAQKMQPSH